MGMRAGKADGIVGESERFCKFLADGVRSGLINSHKIECDEQAAVFGAILDCDSLGEKIMNLAFRNLIATTITRHPHIFFGRDNDGGKPCFPSGFFLCGGMMNHCYKKHN